MLNKVKILKIGGLFQYFNSFGYASQIFLFGLNASAHKALKDGATWSQAQDQARKVSSFSLPTSFIIAVRSVASDVMGQIKYQESTEHSEGETFCIKYENIFDTLALFSDSVNSQRLFSLG